MPVPYRFSGITDFIAGEGVKPSFAVKIPGLFFVGRVVDALSQIPTVDPKCRAEMYAVADEAITALKAAATTAEAAYAHVRAACPTQDEIDAAEAARLEAEAQRAREAQAEAEAAAAAVAAKAAAKAEGTKTK